MDWKRERDRGIGTATGTGWHRQRQGAMDSDRNSDKDLGTDTERDRDRGKGTVRLCQRSVSNTNKMSPENMWNLLKNICRITILQLQRIWTIRNTITQ